MKIDSSVLFKNNMNYMKEVIRKSPEDYLSAIKLLGKKDTFVSSAKALKPTQVDYVKKFFHAIKEDMSRNVLSTSELKNYAEHIEALSSDILDLVCEAKI